MMPFGQLPYAPGSRAQVLSHWLHFFERKGCEVIREGDHRLSILLPGWDESLLGESAAAPLQRWFRDRMTITVQENGTARFRHHYFTPARLFLHAAICAMFLLDAHLGTAPSLRLFTLAHVLIFAVSWAESFIRSGWRSGWRSERRVGPDYNS